MEAETYNIELFSVFEQHNDRSWWYHGNTFYSSIESEEFIKNSPWHKEGRPCKIFLHTAPLPHDLMYTLHFKTFFQIGGSPKYEIEGKAYEADTAV